MKLLCRSFLYIPIHLGCHAIPCCSAVEPFGIKLNYQLSSLIGERFYKFGFWEFSERSKRHYYFSWFIYLLCFFAPLTLPTFITILAQSTLLTLQYVALLTLHYVALPTLHYVALHTLQYITLLTLHCVTYVTVLLNTTLAIQYLHNFFLFYVCFLLKYIYI